MTTKTSAKTPQLFNLHSLKCTPGSRKKHVRLGMGEGSGTGQTATRGQKGQIGRAHV